MPPFWWVPVGLNLLLATALGHLPTLRALEVVETGYASYQGVTTYDDVTSYLGIPYAEPPLGDLRFRAPKPLNVTRISSEAGGSVIDATQYPEFCIQGPLSREFSMASPPCSEFAEASAGGGRGGAGSEDCLKLNIYTPSKAKAGSNRTFGSLGYLLLEKLPPISQCLCYFTFMEGATSTGTQKIGRSITGFTRAKRSSSSPSTTVCRLSDSCPIHNSPGAVLLITTSAFWIKCRP